MSTSAKAGRLITQVTAAPTRRQQYSASTRQALVDAARELFTDNGYAATSLDAVVAQARVTKGALYHHYRGKQGLFEAVFEAEEGEASARVQAAVARTDDPWAMAHAGLRAFLEAVRLPSYRRIVIQEGPAVLGYERFRESEERSAYAIVRDIVRAVLTSVGIDDDADMVDTFSHIFHGAISAAGEAVAGSSESALAAARVDAAITFILGGLRMMAEAGAVPPDPAGVMAEVAGLPSYGEDALDVAALADVDLEDDPEGAADQDDVVDPGAEATPSSRGRRGRARSSHS